MPNRPPVFRTDCFAVSTLAQLKEFGLLADHLDDAVVRSLAGEASLPRTIIRGAPGTGRHLVVHALAQDLVAPVHELHAAVRSGPADVIDFLEALPTRGPALVHVRHAHLLRKESQELVAKAFASNSNAGSIVHNIDRDMAWTVPSVGRGIGLVATTTDDDDLLPCLDASFDLRLQLRLTPGTARHRVRRALHACGLQPTQGATVLLAAIWCADPGSALEQVRGLVRMSTDAGQSTVTLALVEAMSNRLLPFIVSCPGAMALIADAIKRAQPRAAAADAAEQSVAPMPAAMPAEVETIPI